MKSNLGHYSGGLMSHNQIFETFLTDGHRSPNQAYKIAKVTNSMLSITAQQTVTDQPLCQTRLCQGVKDTRGCEVHSAV